LTGVTSLDFEWLGATPTCSNGACSKFNSTSPESYACSDFRGSWEEVKSFQDPLPYQTLAVGFRLEITGNMQCKDTKEYSTYFLLSDEYLGDVSLTCQNPSCDSCMTTVTFSSRIVPSGWRLYNYRGVNNLRIIPASTTICISKIRFYILYTLDGLLPYIKSATPQLGPLSGNTTVTVRGQNFFAGIICLFGNKTVPAQYVDNTMIKCLSPPHKSIMDVSVQTSFQKSPKSTLRFHYYNEPILHSFSPQTGSDDGNEVIAIEGESFTSFSSDINLMSCMFGDNISPATFINSSRVECVAPPGSGNVTVMFSYNAQQWQEVPGYFVYTKNTHKKGLLDKYQEYILFGSCGGIFVALVIAVYFWNKKSTPQEGYMPIPEAHISKQYQIAFSDLKVFDRIGRGSAGDVYKGLWQGRDVAVKMVPASNLKLGTEQMIKEAVLMKALNHPNVLEFFGACTVPPNFCIVTAYMPLGSLYKLLHTPSVEFTPQLIHKVCVETTCGLNYLHHLNPPVIHRDLKSHNLLVDSDWTVKVCDFGLARTGAENTMTACGTPCWTAPEVLRRQRYTLKADIYSLGIVFWEIVTREDPYKGMDPFQVVLAVGTRGLRPPIPPTCDSELSHLIKELWQEDPKARPNVDIILKRLQKMQIPELVIN